MGLAKFSGHPDAKRKSEWCQRPTLFAATFCKVFIVYRGVVQLQHDALFSPAQSDLLLATPYLALSSAAWKMGRFGLGGKVVRRKKKKKILLEID